jgi:hypothetical protein
VTGLLLRTCVDDLAEPQDLRQIAMEFRPQSIRCIGVWRQHNLVDQRAKGVRGLGFDLLGVIDASRSATLAR